MRKRKQLAGGPEEEEKRGKEEGREEEERRHGPEWAALHRERPECQVDYVLPS